MKASELRIGNLVYRKGYVYEITSIQKESFSSTRTSGYEFAIINEPFIGQELDESPIPLTEDWLLKFGGKQDDYYKGIVIEIILLSGREARFIFQKSGYLILHDCRKNIVIGKIPFVHQFQNIHFTLTGSELTIKETVK